ncbi:MAG: CDP-alcohol phosphatidyltransferase family protein [Flavobacteriaceae bacterium]|jgi:CDP-diacylglycerol--serine O-phosphatidyltransferase|nr:CDP-alcohol phosphatidyltransferase family protein [Flavobacteriaceae bacterium]
MSLKKYIPNLFTLLNLFSGCIALVFVSKEHYSLVFFFVCLGIFFDFFDGFFARLLKVQSPLGVQLDSLADMVTSGVVPGYVMYNMIKNIPDTPEFLPYAGFIITLGSCYRLAKFNIDTRQTDSFIGLPTPANALFFVSLPLINESFYDDNFSGVVFPLWLLLVLIVLSAYVLNAEIPLFSLKIKSFRFEKYKLQIFFLILSLAFLVLLNIAAIPLIILSYILLSLIFRPKSES